MKINKREIAIVAITKNGIEIAKKLKNDFGTNGAVDIFVPAKFPNTDLSITYFQEPVAQKIGYIFSNYSSLILIFSLGAVIRLVSPYLKDKKIDPAVVVIDDSAKFVISTLSGHLGGANELTIRISNFLKSMPVITTAADVNKTISVDLVGNKFGWVIDNYENVTKTSAMMVNEEKIGVFQDAGEKDWWSLNELPKNVDIVNDINDLLNDNYKACLIITDKLIFNKMLFDKSVIYRPKTLVVGIGLHWSTTKETIEKGIMSVMDENRLSFKSIKLIASLDKGKPVKGLDTYCRENNINIMLFSKENLGKVIVPNPSEIVGKYEGTYSVSEASSLLASDGILIVPKRKFPPDLTVAISRVISN
ncbi:MAG: cobalamin biosynthesis protein [Thermoproteota archaeon]|nr:cobalamin biosynthesis protein [Thermoproteota archaeon]